MHIEFLVEDRSGTIALLEILPKILTEGSTFKVHAYKGIGHIPKGMQTTLDASKRHLLNHLPRLLSGYGKAFEAYPEEFPAAVVLVCDLDNRNQGQFLSELKAVLANCNPAPKTRFCLCIEEGEAWLLGHREAVETAYPNAKKSVLDGYVQDSVCGTWELLADAVYPGGSAELARRGKMEIGRFKAIWAKEISPLIDVEQNVSPSFKFFAKTVRELSTT